MHLKTVTLDELCPTISYAFKLSYLRDTHLVDLLIISFHGAYRYGSAGSSDAGLITGIVATGVAAFDPFSVVIDFSDLAYTWGDDLDLSFDETGPIRTAVVVGEKCRKAMSTLMFGLDTSKDIVDNDFFFDDLEAAIEKVKNRQ